MFPATWLNNHLRSILAKVLSTTNNSEIPRSLSQVSLGSYIKKWEWHPSTLVEFHLSSILYEKCSPNINLVHYFSNNAIISRSIVGIHQFCSYHCFISSGWVIKLTDYRCMWESFNRRVYYSLAVQNSTEIFLLSGYNFVWLPQKSVASLCMQKV